MEQDQKYLKYQVVAPEFKAESDVKHIMKTEKSESISYEELLKEYFQLEVDLEKLYDQWSLVDPNFSKIAKNYLGVRMLRQDPVENLFAFICSSNNNIQRFVE